MLAIGEWLGSLGLGQHAQAFERHNIDIDLLSQIDDQMLKEIGIASVGHRLRIRAAIAKLKDPETSIESASNAASERSGAAAERRHVTVMFTELVGSTALSTRLDPEDLRAVIGAYQTCVAATIARFDGFVAKYMGEGALVYFGYPHAHEDDAERAVRAGLALVDAVAGLSADAPQVRVGIATGLVVVGDRIGSGEAQERGIVGQTPNLAARLQAMAEPGTVVIGAGTRRLIGNLFELQDRGAADLKGITGRAHAWVALRPCSVESRFEALHADGLTSLVGRDDELETLYRHWVQAKSGMGEVVLMSGEAGIGKSRITAALMERLDGEPHMRLRYFCSPQHTDSAFYPIIGHIERAAGLAHDESLPARFDKLDALLAQSGASAQNAALIAGLLSLPNDGRYPTLDLAPEERRQKTIEALNARVEGLARSQPILAVFEDAHWADPTSLQVLGHLVERLATLRILLIVTLRPEFEPSWSGRARVTNLVVQRLGQRDVAAMIDNVVGDKPISLNVKREIIERTDGIPLFVEEMTKAVLETKSKAAAEQFAAAVPSAGLAVPATLHASLTARLDRLGPAKEVAQIGAAIGREFSHALIASLAGMSEIQLRSALERLIAAGLLFRQGLPPDASYLFKHALVQDAAYGMLLRDPRRALHARIVEALDTHFPEVAETQPEVLARHCTEAGLIEKAAGFWSKAGQRSLEHSALTEAAEQLARARDQLATLPMTPALRREQIKVQVALITPLLHIKGYAAPETKAAAERARLLIEQAEALGDPPEDPILYFAVLHSFWRANYVGFDGDAMRDLAAQSLAFAEKQKTTLTRMHAHRLMGLSLAFTGDLEEGRAHLDCAHALYDRSEQLRVAALFGPDADVVVLCFRAITLWLLGYPKAALADCDHALRSAREIGQAGTSMAAFGLAGWVPLQCGQYAAVERLIDELTPLSEEKGTVFWDAYAMLQQGSLCTFTGKSADAVRALTAGIARWRSTGGRLFVPLHLTYLARAQAELGQFDQAWRCIGEAAATVDATNERLCEANIYVTAGDIACKAPQADLQKAAAYYERALGLARAQRAKAWELRAATGLARLWQERPDEARALLAPIYGSFPDGFETADLEAAKSLLGDLERRAQA